MAQQIASALEDPDVDGGPATSGEFFDRAVSALTHIDPRELEQHRSQLMRYALWLLGSRAAAEDAVQDTLLAALQAPAHFAGRSSVRTWLFGILKHKVADTFRRQSRELPLDDEGDDGTIEPRALFTEDGQWKAPPSDWGDPEQALGQRRFFEVLERCGRHHAQ
jgi:RNA polymerase sigma-70 factor (ECF subfamily)